MNQLLSKILKRTFCVCALLSLLTGCAHLPYKTSSTKEAYMRNAQKHIIHINKYGYVFSDEQVLLPISKRNTSIPLSPVEVGQKYTTILSSALSDLCKKRQQNIKTCLDQIEHYFNVNTSDSAHTQLSYLDGTDLNLLVFFHGGLNNSATTSHRMEKQIELIKQYNEGLDTPIFPVYISWPSGIFDSYSQHIFESREGRNTTKGIGFISSPAVLLDDLISVIGEFPKNLYYQFTNEKDWFASGYSGTSGWLSSIWKDAFQIYTNVSCMNEQELPDSNAFVQRKINNIYINRSRYLGRGVTGKAKGALLATTSILRYPIGSIYNSAVASNGYAMMKRRARNLFYPAGMFDGRFSPIQNTNKNTGFADAGSHAGTFFESILNFQQANPNINVNITLVGHSMGAIAVNNLLSKYKKRWTNSTVLQNIVFMAGADSVQNTIDIIPDILKSNSNIGFYNLTLNRVSENVELWPFPLAWLYSPSGSLLVSIDKYHDEPEHHLLRTIGSELNVHSSLHALLPAFKDLENEIVFKSFNDLGKSTEYPTTHGDFSEMRFWDRNLWLPSDENNLPVQLDTIETCEFEIDERSYKKVDLIDEQKDVLVF